MASKARCERRVQGRQGKAEDHECSSARLVGGSVRRSCGSLRYGCLRCQLRTSPRWPRTARGVETCACVWVCLQTRSLLSVGAVKDGDSFLRVSFSGANWCMCAREASWKGGRGEGGGGVMTCVFVSKHLKMKRIARDRCLEVERQGTGV
jgi:hypothetical protein